MADLNPQQLKFLEHYITGLSVPKAAIVAGYAESSASNVGNTILRSPAGKAFLKEINDRAAAELGITAMKVLKELSDIAFASPGDVITTDEDGEPDVKIGKMKGTEVNITSTNGKVKSKITSIKTIKNSDKINALGLLMKHMGLTSEKVEVEHTGSLLDLIEKSYQTPTTSAAAPASE